MPPLIRLIRATLAHPLNRRSVRTKSAALWRVLRWQLASRLMPEAAIALPFVRSTSLVTHRGMVGATGNWYSGLDEPDEMGLLLHLLRKGDVFVDVGANIGSYTILAASTPGVTCVAFEPVPRTFAFLSRNVAFNGMGERVTARRQGVSDAPGMLHFTTALDSMNYVVADPSQAGGRAIAVEAVRLDDAALPLPALGGSTILKIDVEGFEMSVLKGAKNVLSAPTTLCVIMETNASGERYGVADADLVTVMAGYGLQPYAYSALTRQLVPASNQSAHINTVFVRTVQEVIDRVSTAPTVQLVNGLL